MAVDVSRYEEGHVHYEGRNKGAGAVALDPNDIVQCFQDNRGHAGSVRDALQQLIYQQADDNIELTRNEEDMEFNHWNPDEREGDTDCDFDEQQLWKDACDIVRKLQPELLYDLETPF